MPKILVVGSTHGHERIGLRVIEELKKLNIDRNILDFEIGNPKASENNVPYLESDLNRIFPGKENGNYEEMRAFDLSKKIKSADFVIDIHSTNTTDLSENSMLIVTKYDEATVKIINIINPPKVLYMKYRGENALISQTKIGIAFEYGMDNSEKVLQATLHDIAKVLVELKLLETNPYLNIRPEVVTDVFEVYDSYKKSFEGRLRLDESVSNFNQVEKGKKLGINSVGEEVFAEDSFVPILFGENRYTEILGFKARKI